MTSEDRLKLIKAFLETQCFPLMETKGRDYCAGLSVVDANSNFKALAETMQGRGLDAMDVWWIYLMKQIMAIQTWVNTRTLASESLTSRFADAVNYLLIGMTLLAEWEPPVIATHKWSSSEIGEVSDAIRQSTVDPSLGTLHKLGPTIPGFLSDTPRRSLTPQDRVARIFKKLDNSYKPAKDGPNLGMLIEAEIRWAEKAATEVTQVLPSIRELISKRSLVAQKSAEEVLALHPTPDDRARNVADQCEMPDRPFRHKVIKLIVQAIQEAVISAFVQANVREAE